MSEWLNQEANIRLVIFFSVFATLFAFELYRPRRSLSISKLKRWSNNLGLLVVNTLIVRVVFPAAAVGIAFWAEAQGVGLLNLMGIESTWLLALTVVLSVAFLDLCIWYQHKLFHEVPILWRLHRIHHADLDFDLTTGLRFHPIEVLLSMLIKTGLILAFGFSPLAVLIFEILLNSSAMFTHANIRLPASVDRWVRKLFVTPDMHRVHHSWRKEEANSNYGFNLAIWDRAFNTYREDSVDGQKGIVFGISKTPRDDAVLLWKLLQMPFKQ